jgi:osmotically-inducible protein OsmY
MADRKKNTNESRVRKSKSNSWMMLSITLFLIILGLTAYILVGVSDEVQDIYNDDIETVDVGDETMENNINNQLLWDSRVLSEDVNVEVTEGKVTLTGVVPTYTAKKEAAQSALDVADVISVDNELVVEADQNTNIPNDKTLEERIDNIYFWNVNLESYDIDVAVDDGTVTLTGNVDTLWRKTEAEDLAYNVSGVYNVNNQLAVVYTEDLTDERIAEDIVQSLERNIAIDEEDIDVKVANGTVTLNGKVDSLYQYNEVEDAALFTNGVISIDNQIVIK